GPFAAASPRRIDLPGGYAIYAYAELRQILRQSLGEPDDAVLGSRDMRAVLEPQQRGDAGEGDDASVARPLERGKTRLGEDECAVQIGGKGAAPVREADFIEMDVLPERGIEHENVEAAETVQHRIDHRLHLAGVRDIRGVGLAIRTQRPDLIDDAARLVDIRARVHCHSGAARGEGQRNRASDI